MTDVAAAQSHDTRQFCGAKTRAGTPCRRPAGWGTDHPGFGTCKLHLGSTRNAGKHAETLMLEHRMADLMLEYNRDPAQVDPSAELLVILSDTLAMRSALQLLVGELGPFGTPAYVEYPIQGDGISVGEPNYRPAYPAGIYGPDHKGDGKPHVLVSMLADWSDRAAKQSKLAIDAGIEQRRLDVLEREADHLVSVMRAALSFLIDRAVEVSGDASLARELSTFVGEAMRRAIESGVIDVGGEG